MQPDTGELFTQFARAERISKSLPASLFLPDNFSSLRADFKTDSVAKFESIRDGFFERENLNFDFVNQMTFDTGGVNFV